MTRKEITFSIEIDDDGLANGCIDYDDCFTIWADCIPAVVELWDDDDIKQFSRDGNLYQKSTKGVYVNGTFIDGIFIDCLFREDD